MNIANTLEHMVRVLLGVAILVAYLAWRWKRASNASEAMAAEHSAALQGFEHLKRDPRFLPLWQHIASRYRATYDEPSDAASYCIRHIGLADTRWQRVPADATTGARYMAAYLERGGSSPSRIQATLDLQTGVCTDAEIDSTTWDCFVPAR